MEHSGEESPESELEDDDPIVEIEDTGFPTYQSNYKFNSLVRSGSSIYSKAMPVSNK